MNFQEEVDLQDAYNTVDPIEKKIDGLSRVYLRKFTVKPYSGKYVTKPTTGDGSAKGIVINQNVQRREWNVRVLVGQQFNVYQRRLGTIFSVSDHSIEDEQSSYEENELVGWRLCVREQEQVETFGIAANSASSITVDGVSTPGGLSNLLVIATDKDTYAVERLEPVMGKILKATVTMESGKEWLALTVDSSAGFSSGDEVVVITPAGEEFVTTINFVSDGMLSIEQPLPFAALVGSTVSWFWRSEDGTCGFSLVQGDTDFVVGDELYVDTFALSGDIKLRPENFPRLNPKNLVLNAIGGVK
jgi:hypothetical protein